MSIDFDKFLNWAESRFDNVVLKGNEIKLNSIFCEDHKHHLWCNPSGGKNANQHGVYHCWKTDQKGTLVSLVMQVERCSFEQALEILDATSQGNLAELELKVQEIFSNPTTEVEKPQNNLTIPPGSYRFDELPSVNQFKVKAEDYLKSRKITTDKLFLCTQGRYKNRILIPYYDKSGNLIYYNGRYVGDYENALRYLGPPKELGIGKGDVLYCPSWPKEGEKVYITEGEFDAMSLFSCGFNSIALGGKSMTENQINMIKGYVPVLCLDSDEAGSLALPKIATSLFQRGFSKVYYVRPCVEFKDWNGLLVQKGEKILKYYVKTQERPYNSNLSGGDWETTRLSIKNIIN